MSARQHDGDKEEEEEEEEEQQPEQRLGEGEGSYQPVYILRTRPRAAAAADEHAGTPRGIPLLPPAEAGGEECPANFVIDGSIRDFISGFYAVSDDPGRTEEWLGYFAASPSPPLLLSDHGGGGGGPARVKLGEQEAVGPEEIRALRMGMWEKTRRRRHRLRKVEVTAVRDGGARVEYTIYGSVLLTARDDSAATTAASAAVAVAEPEARSTTPKEVQWYGLAEIERRAPDRRQHSGDAWRYRSYEVVLLP
ncbi:hypothetical protein MN608_00419 [Microdochium nivale]|nr:hypothetical protein MN608_00419 [Microdochium nivale]